MKIRAVVCRGNSFTATTNFLGATMSCVSFQKNRHITSFYVSVESVTEDRSDWYCIWHRGLITDEIIFTDKLPVVAARLRDSAREILTSI